MNFTVFKDENGEFRWRASKSDGEIVRINPGRAPRLATSISAAKIRKNVQAALRQRAERDEQERTRA